MKVEPSDIIGLLKTLGHDDPTCRMFATLGERGEPILQLCHEAIRILAAEKARHMKTALELHMLLPPRPMIVSKDDPLALGILAEGQDPKGLGSKTE